MYLQIFRKEQEIEALKKKMATTALSESEMKIIQKGLNELEKEANHAKEKMKEVIKEEQEMPLNVDTISKVHIRYFIKKYPPLDNVPQLNSFPIFYRLIWLACHKKSCLICDEITNF